MKRLLLLSLLLVLVLASCQRYEPPEFRSDQPVPDPVVASPTPSPTAAPEISDRELEADFSKIAESLGGGVGIGVLLIETGESAYLDRHGRYPMLSVHKLPIAMAVLQKVDKGQLRLYQEIAITPEDFVRPGYNSPLRYEFPEGVVLPLRDVIEASIAESDGTASDVLLRLAGGPEGVQGYLTEIGLGDAIGIAVSEKSMSTAWEMQYANWATPEASVRLLQSIQERRAGLSEGTTLHLLEVMSNSSTGERRVMGGLPRGTPYAHKTGSGGRENGVTSATNDVGLITTPDGRHIAIAVYIKDSKSPTAARLEVMREIAAAVWKKWIEKSDARKGDNERDLTRARPQKN